VTELVPARPPAGVPAGDTTSMPFRRLFGEGVDTPSRSSDKVFERTPRAANGACPAPVIWNVAGRRAAQRGRAHRLGWQPDVQALCHKRKIVP